MKNEYSIENEVPNLLSSEEFNVLIREARNGSLASRNKIIEHNIRLVIYEVKKHFSNFKYMKDELISVGLIGLIKAADYFDYTRDITFATYSLKCINREIIQYLKQNEKHSKNISLNEPIYNNFNSEEKAVTLLNVLLSDFNIEEQYENQEIKDIVNNLLSHLTDQQHYIIVNLYGLEGKEAINQSEIARRIGISKQALSVKIVSIHKKLKKLYNDLYLERKKVLKK